MGAPWAQQQVASDGIRELGRRDRMTRDEVNELVQTAPAPEDRRNQEPGAASGA